MIKTIFRVTETAANHIGFLDFYAFLRRKVTMSRVAIFAYHRVGPNTDNWSLESLPPGVFERQMEYLQEKKRLPEKAVVVTFDDGYRDNYTYAYPILRKRKIVAAIFLATGHISTDKLFWWDKVGYIIHHTHVKSFDLLELGSYSMKDRKDKSKAQIEITEKLKIVSEERKQELIKMLAEVTRADVPKDTAREMLLSWDQVKEMNNNGITFGAHTVNHPILTKVPLEAAKWEIMQSKIDIESVLRNKVLTFSYPNGNHCDEVSSIVRKAGFICAVSILPSQLIRPDANNFSLSRIIPSADDSQFKTALSGLAGDCKLIASRLKIGKRMEIADEQVQI
jgi:peptidoglycan/xylan/chitin deacetylase (PgdA/CDA1 family)